MKILPIIFVRDRTLIFSFIFSVPQLPFPGLIFRLRLQSPFQAKVPLHLRLTFPFWRSAYLENQTDWDLPWLFSFSSKVFGSQYAHICVVTWLHSRDTIFVFTKWGNAGDFSWYVFSYLPVFSLHRHETSSCVGGVYWRPFIFNWELGQDSHTFLLRIISSSHQHNFLIWRGEWALWVGLFTRECAGELIVIDRCRSSWVCTWKNP